MDPLIENRIRIEAKDKALFKQCLKTKGLYLNIGCGDSRYDGLINIDKFIRGKDVLPADALYLPFKPGTVSLLYSAHSIEHLPIREGKLALRAWYEVLKVGGRLILELPDLQAICQNIVNSNSPEHFKWYMYTLFGYQIDPRNPDTLEAPRDLGQFHLSGYTHTSLCLEWTQLGFKINEFVHVDGYNTPSMHVDAVKV